MDPKVTDERARARTLDRLSDRIAITVFSAGNQGDERSTAGTIYSFHYMDFTRERSLRVVETLLTTFVEQTLGGKREGSEHAQRFLETQIKDYEQRLSAAEDRLAAFKKKNVGLMPSEQGGYFTQLQNEVDAAKKAETESVDRHEPPRGTRQAAAQRQRDLGGRHLVTHGGRAARKRRQRHLEPHSGGAGQAR